MKLNELDAGGETPPDIISNVDDIQQGFDVAKFTEMIGHTLAEKKHIINAKEVMQEISSGYQELIDDEIYDVISAMNHQLDWIADSMQWLSEKIVDRALEIRQQEEKQLKTLIEKELVTHETEKAYFVSIPKAVMKSNMDGFWIPKRIMKWNDEANSYEVQYYPNFKFTEYEYSKTHKKLKDAVDKKEITGDEFKSLMVATSIHLDHLRNIDDVESIEEVKAQERKDIMDSDKSKEIKWSDQLLDEDGNLKTWERQLLEYEYGLIDNTPLVLQENSKDLSYAKVDDLPITMNTSTLRKLKSKHNISGETIVRSATLLHKTLLAMQSKEFDDSLVFLLDEKNEEKYPMIMVLRENKKLGTYEVNEITSIYDKKNFENLFKQSINEHRKVWLNPEKIKEITSQDFQFVPDSLSLYIDNISGAVQNQDVIKGLLLSTLGKDDLAKRKASYVNQMQTILKDLPFNVKTDNDNEVQEVYNSLSKLDESIPMYFEKALESTSDKNYIHSKLEWLKSSSISGDGKLDILYTEVDNNIIESKDTIQGKINLLEPCIEWYVNDELIVNEQMQGSTYSEKLDALNGEISGFTYDEIMRRCDEAHSLFKDKLQNDILDEDIAGGETPPRGKRIGRWNTSMTFRYSIESTNQRIEGDFKPIINNEIHDLFRIVYLDEREIVPYGDNLFFDSFTQAEQYAKKHNLQLVEYETLLADVSLESIEKSISENAQTIHCDVDDKALENILQLDEELFKQIQDENADLDSKDMNEILEEVSKIQYSKKELIELINRTGNKIITVYLNGE